MTTRGQFKDMVGRWSKRPDVTSLPLDDFFELAYQRVSRGILPSELDAEVALDPERAKVVRGNTWAHPLTWSTGDPAVVTTVDVARVWSVTNNACRLRTVRTDAIKEFSDTSAVNSPAWYAVVGMEIWTAPGVGGDLRMIYAPRDTKPTDDTQTNFGLTNYLDAYLWAGLVALYQYSVDPENEMGALRAYDASAARLNMEAERRRRGGGAGGVS